MTLAALVVTLSLLSALTLMQILLIRGTPIGAYAWGGQHEVLPPRMRAAAAGAIVLYVLFALLLLSRAGVLPGGGSGPVVVGTWVLAAYAVVSVVPNAISRSRDERRVQVPVSILLALGVLVIAVDPG